MIQAVLFDLDGTLTNTLRDIATAMNRALRLNGLPEFPEDAYRYLVGDGVRMLAQRAVRDRQELRQTVQDAYQTYYEKHTLDATAPYPGVPELLQTLSQRGIKLCVLSNKPDADTRGVVAHFFPEIAFSVVRGQLAGVPVKPDPAGAVAITQALRIPPADFLYLGDPAVDMTCALRAGMHGIGVLWGFRQAEELQDAGAERLIDTPEALLPLLP